MRNGMTLMSVMVAVALASIVALAVARLLGNQSKTMSVVRLREQREQLLKHYKNIVISGWDRTRRAVSAGAIRARDGNVVIPAGGLYLADDLYDYNHSYSDGTANRWWKVSTTTQSLTSGSMLQSDTYARRENLVAVKVKVDFVRREHPTVTTRLAPREEIVFLHHNTVGTNSPGSTDCRSGHPTQVDRDGSALYAGSGAIIQYDFNSNYTKCSQVPLVSNADTCSDNFEAMLGFFRNNITDQLVTGRAICSITHKASTLAAIRDTTEKRTVEAIDCSGTGYVEWIDVDEKPRCVSPFDTGTDGSARVAAESRNDELAGTHSYTLIYRLTSGRNSGSATYAPGGCTIRRYKGITHFKESGLSGEVGGYVAGYLGSGSVVGPPGPDGDDGANDGPPGPPGVHGDCGCCCSDPCPPGTP